MRYSSLALAFAFVAIAFLYFANARSQGPDTARKTRLAAGLFLLAAAAFLFAFGISFMGEDGGA